MSRKNTKERIFIEALRLFSEQGYKETTVRQIAAAVPANEATLYIYFDGKAKILEDILNMFERKLDRCFFIENSINANMQDEKPEKVLNRLRWNKVLENDMFMRQAFRIVCMEQFTNQKAEKLIVERLHIEMEKTLCLELNNLIEHKKIPAFDDTYTFAALWVQNIFAEAVLLVHSPPGAETVCKLAAVNALLLDMAGNGGKPLGDGSHASACIARG